MGPSPSSSFLLTLTLFPPSFPSFSSSLPFSLSSSFFFLLLSLPPSCFSPSFYFIFAFLSPSCFSPSFLPPPAASFSLSLSSSSFAVFVFVFVLLFLGDVHQRTVNIFILSYTLVPSHLFALHILIPMAALRTSCSPFPCSPDFRLSYHDHDHAAAPVPVFSLAIDPPVFTLSFMYIYLLRRPSHFFSFFLSSFSGCHVSFSALFYLPKPIFY